MSLFRKSAGYRYLDAFILANVIELGTRHFCRCFLNLRNDPGGRTFAQMTHAARSGSRNFAEGSERLMTSYASAMELLDVARASLCELRDDYNAWLMMDRQAPWPMDSVEAQRIYGLRLDAPDYGNDINRGVCLHILAQYGKFEHELNADDSMVRANTLLILISRTLNMMDKYIKNLGAEFTEQGGFRERLTPCVLKRAPGTTARRRTRRPVRNAVRRCVSARPARKIAPSGAVRNTPRAAG